VLDNKLKLSTAKHSSSTIFKSVTGYSITAKHKTTGHASFAKHFHENLMKITINDNMVTVQISKKGTSLEAFYIRSRKIL
jgi:hypothetical protein